MVFLPEEKASTQQFLHSRGRSEADKRNPSEEEGGAAVEQGPGTQGCSLLEEASHSSISEGSVGALCPLACI